MSDDNSKRKHYRTEIPNMADDDLGPYEYRLYAHYKRVCGDLGECWESVRTTADKTQMSVGKVSSVRRWLVDEGWLEEFENGKLTLGIRVVDRWDENLSRYQRSPHEQDEDRGVHHMNTNADERSPDEHSGEDERSPHEQSPESVHHMNAGVHDMNKSVHHMKQRRTYKKEPIKNIPPAGAGETKPKPTRKRDLLWEAVLLENFRIRYKPGDKVPGRVSGRVNRIAKELRDCEPEPTGDEYTRFMESWKGDHPGMELKSDEKIVTEFMAWRNNKDQPKESSGPREYDLYPDAVQADIARRKAEEADKT